MFTKGKGDGYWEVMKCARVIGLKRKFWQSVVSKHIERRCHTDSWLNWTQYSFPRNLTAPGVALGSAVVGNRPGHGQLAPVLKLCFSCVELLKAKVLTGVGTVSGTLNHRCCCLSVRTPRNVKSLSYCFLVFREAMCSCVVNFFLSWTLNSRSYEFANQSTVLKWLEFSRLLVRRFHPKYYL